MDRPSLSVSFRSGQFLPTADARKQGSNSVSQITANVWDQSVTYIFVSDSVCYFGWHFTLILQKLFLLLLKGFFCLFEKYETSSCFNIIHFADIDDCAKHPCKNNAIATIR